MLKTLAFGLGAVSSTHVPDRPDRPARAPTLPWHRPGAIRIVADGNSIVAGGQDGPESVGGVAGYLHRRVAPFMWQRYVDRAVGGQTTDDMLLRAGDVDAAFERSTCNVLLVQEGTNQSNTGDSPGRCCDKLLAFAQARRDLNPWTAVVLATAPPAYLGDALPERATIDYNRRLDAFNALLRRRWRDVADALVENRAAAGPFAGRRYPDYRRATFFDATRVDGMSNAGAFVTEPLAGPAPRCKIHPTAAAIAALAPIWAVALLGISTPRP